MEAADAQRIDSRPHQHSVRNVRSRSSIIPQSPLGGRRTRLVASARTGQMRSQSPARMCTRSPHKCARQTAMTAACMCCDCCTECCVWSERQSAAAAVQRWRTADAALCCAAPGVVCCLPVHARSSHTAGKQSSTRAPHLHSAVVSEIDIDTTRLDQRRSAAERLRSASRKKKAQTGRHSASARRHTLINHCCTRTT